MYSDADAAALYDVLNPWGPSDDFYLSFVMDAPTVLDVGCGTGTLLHRARESGHGGRLCGLDPDPAMLDRARRRDDIEWVEGRAEDAAWDREFELAVMTSNAFQVFVTDEDVHASLVAIRTALTDDGRFVYGSLNPRARAWQDWNRSNAFDVVDHVGRELRLLYDVESVVGDVVTFTETTATRHDEPLRVDRTSLRFLDLAALRTFLTAASFEVETSYGDWSRAPLTAASADILVVARAATGLRTLEEQDPRIGGLVPPDV
jgi:SAM-dependent methyltransferase